MMSCPLGEHANAPDSMSMQPMCINSVHDFVIVLKKTEIDTNRRIITSSQKITIEGQPKKILLMEGPINALRMDIPVNAMIKIRAAQLVIDLIIFIGFTFNL